MILKVKNKEGKNLGIFEVTAGGFKFLEGERDESFEKFISGCFVKGVPSSKDIYDTEKNISTIIMDHTNSDNPLFPYALKSFLEREGYLVSERYPETEEEIKKLLAGFPDDDPNKIDILKRLPEMSRLEQTTFLAGLRKIEGES